MNPLDGLGVVSRSLLPNLLMSGFFMWLMLSVIAVVLYRLFRSRPEDVTSEFVVLEPKKKKRG